MDSILSRLYGAKWVLLGIVLALILLWVAWPFLNAIVYAVFFYYITRPIKRRLRPYIKNDTLLALACIFLVTLPLMLVIGYTLLLAIGQLSALAGNIGNLPLASTPLERLGELIYGAQSAASGNIRHGDLGSIIHDWLPRIKGYMVSTAGIQGILLSTGMTLVDILFNVLLILFIAFYLLRDDGRIISWAHTTFPGLTEERDGLLIRYGKAVDADLESIFFGNVLSVVIFAMIAAAVYSILNFFAPDPAFTIPYPLLMGILLGIAAFLPIVGPWLIDVPILLYVLAQALLAGTFFPNTGYFILMAAAIFIFVETLPGYVLRPFISHGRVNVGLLMFAYILGPIVFGIAGLFIAVIVLAMLTHYFLIVVPDLAQGQQAP